MTKQEKINLVNKILLSKDVQDKYNTEQIEALAYHDMPTATTYKVET